jgi:hypothetical protein
VQLDASVSASRAHRKYAPLLARVLDARGQLRAHAGTDGLENQWEDAALLNYRKVEAWDLLAREAVALVASVGGGGGGGADCDGGLYLCDAHSYPLMQALDRGELFRRDADGSAAYTAREALEGEVVLANAEAGFWTCAAAATYANPLLAKVARAVWAARRAARPGWETA